MRVKAGPIQSTNPWLTVVGVVGDVKSDSLETPGAPHIYLPIFQSPPYNPVVYLRTTGDAGSSGESIRREVLAIDPRTPTYAARAMEEVVARSMAERRFALDILGFFGLVALILAAIGIYGVMTYTFSQRTQEIGIRMALGAQRGDILRMAIGEGMLLVGVGLGTGILGALILTRYLRTMLFAITPTDPVTFASIAVLLSSVALLACFVPARRATQVDPLVALRNE
jgi:putative ABC transport system permease protein